MDYMDSVLSLHQDMILTVTVLVFNFRKDVPCDASQARFTAI